MKTFEILQEYRALEILLNEVNEETGEFINSEDDIKEYIDDLKENKEDKLNNIEKLKREIDGSINTIDAEIKRLQQLKKQRSNNIERLKNLQMLLTNGEKIETDLYKFSTRKSASVEITDLDLIQDKYCKFEKKPVKKDILDAIKQAEKNKESFFGAEIVEKISITVK